MREIASDPITVAALGVLARLLRLVTAQRREPIFVPTPIPRAPTPLRPVIPDHLPEPEFPVATAYEDRADYVAAVAVWMDDPSVRIRTRAEGIQAHGAEIWDEIGGKEANEDRRRGYRVSVQVSALQDYVRWQTGGIQSRYAPADCYDLDRNLIAFCNVSDPEHVASAVRTLVASRGSDARRLKLMKMSGEGYEIRKLYPGAWQLIEGEPRGKWPLPPPPEPAADEPSAPGRPPGGMTVKPPGGG